MKSKPEETMAMQAQPSTGSDLFQTGCFGNESIVQKVADGGQRSGSGQAVDNQYRAGAYSLLAALLRQPPQQAVLTRVTGLADVLEKKDEFAIAMSVLGLAAREATVLELDDEYHALFIGLGRGELVPYGSWYLTGYLMEKPLGVLRDDLASMGFSRNEGSCEPEDHVAALCEVMALLINEGRSLAEQTLFFDAHISPWWAQFFSDLGEAKSAIFYCAVARFGQAFFNFEKQYLAMGA